MKQLKRNGLMMVFLLTALSASAQHEGDGVSVKVTKDQNGETTTFEKTYESMAEMNDDPEFQDFVGDGKDVNMLFSGKNDHSGFKFGSMASAGNGFFFDLNEAGERSAEIIQMLTDEEAMRQITMHLDQLPDQLADLNIDIRDFDGGDNAFFYSFGDSKIEVSEVGDVFGKRATVDEKEKLEGDIQVRSFGQSGHLQVVLDTKETGELEISVSNTKGKVVLQRYVEDYEGQYRESLDFNNQKAGEYLLEIKVGEKRLTKRLVID